MLCYVDMDVTVQSVCLYVSTCLCVSLVGEFYLYLPQMKFGGIFFSPCLFVCLSVHPFVRPSIHLSICLFVYLSVCLSVCQLFVDMILRDGCIHFYENLYTDYSPFVDVHLEFSYFSIFKLQAFG